MQQTTESIILGTTNPDASQRTADRILRFLDWLGQIVHAAPTAVTHVLAWAAPRALLLVAALVLLRVAIRTLVKRLHPRVPVVLRLTPPGDATYMPEHWVGFYQSLLAVCPPAWKRVLAGMPWLTLELRHDRRNLSAWCFCTRDTEVLVRTAARAALPGVEVRATDPPADPAGLRRSTALLRQWRDPLFRLGESRSEALAPLTQAMSEASVAMFQLSLRPDPTWERRALKRIDRLTGQGGEGLAAGLSIGGLRFAGEILSDFVGIFLPGSTSPAVSPASPPAVVRHPSLPRFGEQSLHAKAFRPAWRCEARICAWAPTTGEAKRAIHAAIGGFRLLDGDNQVGPRRVLRKRAFDRALVDRSAPGAAAMTLSPEELVEFFHLPIRTSRMATTSVSVAPPMTLDSPRGVLACIADGTGDEIRLAQPDRRHHLGISGPTGSGKSTTCLNLGLQDIDTGVGVGVIDPKGDLVADFLERIGREAWDRVVLLDPSRRDRPVGLNILECSDPSQRELVCESVINVFHRQFERYWGPRSEDVLRTSILTLLRHPGTTLCEIPLLLTNDRVRESVTRDLGDPMGLGSFWAEYEAMSPGARLQLIGPLMNKLRAFLLRPSVRNLLGQSRSTIDLSDLLDSGGILLVSLAKGELGEELSHVLASLIVTRVWQAATSRISQPPAQRRDFNLYLDEFQNYLHLPSSIDDVLAEARAYRLNLTLAHQHVGQLPASIADAVDANVRSRIAFQSGPEDARGLARILSPLTEQQLRSLGRHQAALRLCLDGHVEDAFTGLIPPPRPSLGELNAAGLVRHALGRHGRPAQEVEAEIEARMIRLGLRGGFKEIA